MLIKTRRNTCYGNLCTVVFDQALVNDEKWQQQPLWFVCPHVIKQLAICRQESLEGDAPRGRLVALFVYKWITATLTTFRDLLGTEESSEDGSQMSGAPGMHGQVMNPLRLHWHHP